MAYVITEPCIGTKDKSCVDVCPVDCIHGKDEDDMLYIDPEVCIDCAACVAECPVEAIFDEADLPENQQHMIALNADLSKSWPVITQRGGPLPDAEEWSQVKEKMQYLEQVE